MLWFGCRKSLTCGAPGVSRKQKPPHTRTTEHAGLTLQRRRTTPRGQEHSDRRPHPRFPAWPLTRGPAAPTGAPPHTHPGHEAEQRHAPTPTCAYTHEKEMKVNHIELEPFDTQDKGTHSVPGRAFPPAVGSAGCHATPRREAEGRPHEEYTKQSDLSFPVSPALHSEKATTCRERGETRRRQLPQVGGHKSRPPPHMNGGAHRGLGWVHNAPRGVPPGSRWARGVVSRRF